MRDFRGEYILVFRYGVEARAILQALILVDDAVSILVWGIIPMPGNFIYRRDRRDKLLKQEAERRLLLIGPGILGLLVSIKSANIADTDGLFVMILHVSTNLAQRSPEFNSAVDINDKMIAYLAESPMLVPDIDVVGMEVLAFNGVGTVDDDVRHLPSERHAL